MKLACLFACAMVTSAAGSAAAECGTPRWIGTPTNAKIPRAGTLYLYQDALAMWSVDQAVTRASWTGGIGQTWRERRISDTVLAIDYDARDATALEVVDDLEGTNSTQYRVDPGWQAPAAGPRVVQYWHHAMQWTCSSADSVMLQIDQKTAAFRVRWKFAGSKTREWIVPARSSSDHLSVLELGKIDCGHTTIDPQELAQGGELALTAIRLDGSEVPVDGLPPVLSTRQMPTTDEGVERALALATITPGEPEVPLEPPMDRRWPELLFGIAVFVIGGLFLLRNKTRALKTVV